MLARATATQQKDGAVGAADDEQKDDTGQQKRERTPQILLVRHDDRLQPEMPGRDSGMHHLAHDGLERRVGGGHCDVRPQLDPRQVRGGRTVGNSPHETGRQINIADAGDVIECEAARHHPDDGVGGVIDFQRSPDNVGIAAEITLPEAVVENNHRVACIERLDHPAEKGVHTKEGLGILCEVHARDVFRQPVAGDLQIPVAKAKHRLNRGCKAQVITLCLAKGKPAKLVRMLLVDEVGVHDAVGVGVGKRVQQDGVDEREHRRGGADAEREGEYGDGGEARVAAQGAQAVADVSA